ncbi:ABC transporter permease [Terrilactibacillus laevilacticus]|uniref:ABC transporter permease n=1 Tax=Terrilactibacillus laevilacticus TaxID=1380157 RepID=UPI0015EEF185|nr:ABC transporter permease [Terrilactibacillus laevilacticus]
MSIFISIVLTSIKRNIRDRKNVIFLLLFPILLTFILGNALSSVDVGNEAAASLHTKLALVNQDDNGMVSKQYEQFLKSKEIKDIVTTRPISTINNARIQLKQENVDAIVYIPKGFSYAIENGKSKQMQVIVSGNTEGDIIKDLTESFLSRVKSHVVLAEMGKHVIDTQMPPIIYDHPLKVSGKIPKAIDYYAVTMLIMIIMYSANLGKGLVANFHYSSLGSRIRTLPIHPMKFFLGQAVGELLTVAAQIVILIFFFKFAFHANLGDHMTHLILTCFLLGLITILIGIAFSLWFNPHAADRILNIQIPILTFLAGGYVKLPDSNTSLNFLQNIMPNALAQSIIFQDIYGRHNAQGIHELINLFICLVVIFIIVIVGLRRKKYGSFCK